MTAEHVMLDLETLGTGNDAVILSIGAVKFTADEITDRFHVAIDPVSCEQLGLKIDAATVLWWLGDDRAEARKSLAEHQKIDLPSALIGFTNWFNGAAAIWGNGSTFDNVILRSAYKACHYDYPVRFWADLCYRSVKNLVPEVELGTRVGIHHNAVDDAETQARHLQAIIAHLGVPLS